MTPPLTLPLWKDPRAATVSQPPSMNFVVGPHQEGNHGQAAKPCRVRAWWGWLAGGRWGSCEVTDQGQSSSAPRPLAPLSLTTYCPPSRHDCNIHSSICPVSGALIWELWGTRHLPAASCLPLFLSGCGCCTRVWAPEGRRVSEARLVSHWFLLTGYPHSCCHGNVESEQSFFSPACSQLSPCRSLPDTS